FRIFPWNDLRPAMNNGHPAPKTPEHLPELQADVSGSENKKMLRHFRQLHHGFVGEIGDFVQPGNCRNGGAPAYVDEDFSACNEIVSHLNLLRSDEAGMAPVQLKRRTLLHLVLLTLAEAGDDFIFLRHDGAEIDADAGRVDAPASRVACIVSDLRAM